MPRSRRSTATLIAASLVFLGVSVRGQAPDRPPMAEDVFKNVQVLKGIPVNDFMGTMGILSAALGMSCEDCHRSGDSSWANYAADSPQAGGAKHGRDDGSDQQDTFRWAPGGHLFFLSCGADRPKVTPNLLSLYDAPPPEDPRDIVEQASSAPTADAVLDKYIAAVGGAARAASLTSFTAKGSSVGYGPDSDQRPVEIYAKPRINVRRSCIRRAATARRPSMAVRDGSQPRSVPCPVLAVAGADLDGLRLDAELSFPARIREVADRWRVGQQIAIDGRDGAGHRRRWRDRDVVLRCRIRSAGAANPLCRLAVGRIPTQVDYSDYRDVSGVKLPFKWTVTWLDGRDTIELTEVRANVAIDASRFARPRTPAAPPAK